ncbi:MAG TPA: GNAT family N-acetyltransferase [Blastocatellia bacterium]|nr:GNAT family N-acetyltransferase [Blastocatellia bacterium]
MLIRKATRDDIPLLERLIPESARGLSASYYTPQQIESAIVHVFGVDTQLISDGTYFVAEDEGRIVGCGGWSKRRTLYGGDQMKAADDPLLDARTEPARIRAFFVDPGWARRGAGRLLLEACEKAAREAGFGALELVATLPGEPLYKALGYEVSERFDIALPGEVVLPLARMMKIIPPRGDS